MNNIYVSEDAVQHLPSALRLWRFLSGLEKNIPAFTMVVKCFRDLEAADIVLRVLVEARRLNPAANAVVLADACLYETRLVRTFGDVVAVENLADFERRPFHRFFSSRIILLDTSRLSMRELEALSKKFLDILSRHLCEYEFVVPDPYFILVVDDERIVGANTGCLERLWRHARVARLHMLLLLDTLEVFGFNRRLRQLLEYGDTIILGAGCSSIWFKKLFQNI